MIGKEISHYRILEKLGGGSMGVVYKARDLNLDRLVALKFLVSQEEYAEEEKIRFIQEAKTTSALDHPNICTIYEIEETKPDLEESGESYIFISMAYYEGETLKEKIEGGPFSVKDAVDITVQICEGLSKAHKKNIIHRDIKPANIIDTGDGIYKLMDFGIAKLRDSQHLTKTGTIMGTPGYMSPEQAKGVNIDFRTDIWSVGIILYEMLTCRLPFRGENYLSLMYSIINEPLIPIKTYRENIPENLIYIIEKMLSKDPQNRFQTCDELIEILKSLESATFTLGETEKNNIFPLIEKKSPSIAVLPFRDMSPKKDQDYFCDGLAESIITTLTRIPGLRVVSRNSVFQFKNVPIDIFEIREKLKVQTILEGSVQKAGNRVRIAMQLINTSDGFLLWAEDFKQELTDIFEVQDDITEAVVESLKLKLTGVSDTQLYRHHTENIDAYNTFLKGRFYLNQRTVHGVNRSIEYFTQAIDIDPHFALAYAGLADSYAILGIYGAHPPQTVMLRSMNMANKALEFDENLAEAHITLGCIKAVYEWNWREAETEFVKGIELNRNCANGHHWYAINYLVPLGRFKEAKTEIFNALNIDPVSMVINVTLGLIEYFSKNYQIAVQHYKKAMEFQPDFAMSNFFLGKALVQEKKYQEAMSHFQKALDLYGESTNMLATFAHAAALADQQDIAKKTLHSLLDQATQKYVSPYDISCIYLGLGETEKALTWLEKAVEEHAYLLIYLKVDPMMEPLQTHPKLESILKTVFG
jgi:serine/threonine protein kinase/Flp pilus assembly protein TadD